MNALKKFKKTCDVNGFRKGESAKEFCKRAPQSSMRVAKFISDNMQELVKDFSDVMKVVAK